MRISLFKYGKLLLERGTLTKDCVLRTLPRDPLKKGAKEATVQDDLSSFPSELPPAQPTEFASFPHGQATKRHGIKSQIIVCRFQVQETFDWVLSGNSPQQRYTEDGGAS